MKTTAPNEKSSSGKAAYEVKTIPKRFKRRKEGKRPGIIGWYPKFQKWYREKLKQEREKRRKQKEKEEEERKVLYDA